MDYIKHILEILKLAPKVLMPVALVAAVLIFGAADFLETLGLKTFRDNHKSTISVIFLLSSALCVSSFGADGIVWLKKRLRQSLTLRRMQKRLRSLTPEEQEVLRYFVTNATRTQKLDIKNGVVGGLEAAEVIYKSATVGAVFGGWDYNIQP